MPNDGADFFATTLNTNTHCEPTNLFHCPVGCANRLHWDSEDHFDLPVPTHLESQSMTPCKLIQLLSVALLVCMLVPTNRAVSAEDDVKTEASEIDAIPVQAAPLIAKALHDAMHSALRVSHDRYYREDEGLIIPAAALQEVFADVKKTRNITLRWLVVEGQAMNIDHEAQDDFEKAAVIALIAGKEFHAETTAKRYRRAAPITLSNHCLKCHVPDRRSTRDRKAGLIVSIPLAND